MSEQLTRGEIQDLLTGFAAKNPQYRAALLKDPKSVLEGQLNNKMPEGIKVKAVEETADTVYVVVPFVPQAGQELSDGALESVAGGKKKGGGGGPQNYTCNNAKGGFNTRNEFNATVKLV